jgi:hypothetical protein
MSLCIVSDIPMVNATPVQVTAAGASLSKAEMGLGLRQSQQQCRVSIWAQKHADAGCLA